MLALSLQFHTAHLMKLITHLIADIFFNPRGTDQLHPYGLDTVLGYQNI